MDLFYQLNTYYIQFGTGLALLLAAMQFAKKPQDGFPWALIFVGVCLASVQMRLGFYAARVTPVYPVAAIFFFASIFSLGPLVYLHFNSLMRFAISKPRISPVWHFLPALIYLIFEIIFQLKSSEFKQTLLRAQFDHFSFNDIDISLALGSLHVTAYLAYLTYVYARLNTSYEMVSSKLVMAVLFTALAGNQILTTGFIIKNHFLFHLGCDLVTLTCVFIFLANARRPDLFTDMESEIKLKRYEKTRLSGLDLNVIRGRLEELMSEEKKYLDDTLRLQGLAQDLLISPHQLSRILNEIYGLNFNGFINNYRVNAAKELLVGNPGRTVISIAYEVGFNSKSTFNAQFLKIVGVSPAEYRRQTSG